MLDIVLSPLSSIVGPIVSLANGIVKIAYVLGELGLLIPRIVELFNYIFNIPKMLTDILFGLTKGSMMVLETLFTIILGDLRTSFGNNNDKEGNTNKTEDETINLGKDIVELLILIMCPPLAILIKLGWKSGWFLIILSSVLTYFYYFPGLIFAALYVL
jgi:uncharacterized membrane protein YqaE (UPF0057 family)